MSIYDRNESIITDKLSFVKSKREKNSKIKLLPARRCMPLRIPLKSSTEGKDVTL